jgi:hypothetical protein
MFEQRLHVSDGCCAGQHLESWASSVDLSPRAIESTAARAAPSLENTNHEVDHRTGEEAAGIAARRRQLAAG